ncbi:MAG TPA: AMP-binding protein [Chloroflexota bacterium]|nr:AMP-binding protein [Chloroflexota bacterium]
MDTIDRIALEIECLRTASADEIRSRQDRRLAEIVRFHYNNPFNSRYRELLKAHGIEDESELPTSVDDIGRLPTVSRAFLIEADYANHPCVPAGEIRKIIETSGTSGNPLQIPHTHAAVERYFGEFIARSALLSGLNPLDCSYHVVHWIPGGKDVWASHEGTLAFQDIVGADRALITSTHTTPVEHWRNWQTYRPKWALAAPVFFLSFAGYGESQKLDLAACSLEHLLLGAVPLLPEDEEFITRTYGLAGIHQVYTTSENFILAAELPDRSGYLCFADDFIVEVLDYDGKPVAVGERGQVAITCLGNRGYPSIRYRQGDAVTYLGYAADFPGCPVIADIRRVDAGEIGEARLPFSEIDMMPRYLSKLGIPVRALQIARRREGLKDVPLFRIETPVQDRTAVERAVIEVFTRNGQMKDMLEGGIIYPPIVEIYSPGMLSRGRLKVPVYVDEREMSTVEQMSGRH